MKLPQSPPLLDVLGRQLLAPGRAPVLLELLGPPGRALDARYLHWDELRRRPAPAGLTSDEWWLIVKLRRGAAARLLPLVDRAQRPFVYVPSHDKVAADLHALDRGLGSLLKVAEPVLKQTHSAEYLIRSLIDEAITSSQLEGAATTRTDARVMLETRRSPRDRSERMIVNNFLTMQRIIELRDEAMTPARVLELHRLVTHDTLDKADAAGRLRRAEERIVVADHDGQELHVPPDAGELSARLARMCAFANGDGEGEFIHPIVRAVMLHFWLAWEHPFVDGNGRTARALFYWCMVRNGYWLMEYISISEIILKAPVKYGRAYLKTETDDNDFTYFLLYHLEVLRAAVDKLHRYLDSEMARRRSSRALLSAVDGYNLRQRELLWLFLDAPETRVAIADHQNKANVVYETARSDLLGLEESGLVQKVKVGRKWVFMGVQGLAERLAQMGPG